MTIFKRILQARADFLLAHPRTPLPNRVRLPVDLKQAYDAWVDTVEHDPFLGHYESGLKRWVFGMAILVDEELVEPIAEFAD